VTEQRPLYAMAFVDGQNLFQHAKVAFGHHHPNYDPVRLHQAVCRSQGWAPSLVRFYTGVPDAARDPKWHGYWARRALALKHAGVTVTTRRLQYRYRDAYNEYGDLEQIEIAQEKGVDIRIALDIVRLARTKQYDVAVIYSQDQDINEVVEEVWDIAKEQERRVILASAFPAGPNATFQRGINKTQWIKIDQEMYDSCLDHRDYRQ
jgi:uncharacterized LabA/DUF88 family protein